MKKTIILSLMLCLSIALCAQSTQRQKMIHQAAVNIATKIGVSGQERDEFIKMYQEYKKEVALVMKNRPVVSEDKEKAAEAKILDDFDKSSRILAIRRSYYEKFRTILKPTEIQKMYDAERAQRPVSAN